jgi:tol-pal system protein YbgF
MGLFGLGLLIGCGSAGLAEKNDALEQKLAELRRQTDGDRQALHQLENRIFLLEDKLDTAEVARGKVAGVEPRLPVVTKHRPEPAPPPTPAPTPAVDDGPISFESPPPPAPPAPVYDDGPADEGPAVVIRMDGTNGRIEPVGAPPRARDARETHRRERPSASLPDLASINERLPVVPLPKTTGGSAPVAAEDPMTAYQEARAALGRREHAAAILGFKKFVDKWPTHDYADNALYWLGEAYYDQADYRTALVEFRAVVQRYPAGNKAPDALLKVGFCLGKLGEAAAANDVLNQVAQIYPKTDAARLAQKRLGEPVAQGKVSP